MIDWDVPENSWPAQLRLAAPRGPLEARQARSERRDANLKEIQRQLQRECKGSYKVNVNGIVGDSFSDLQEDLMGPLESELSGPRVLWNIPIDHNNQLAGQRGRPRTLNANVPTTKK